MGRPRAEKEREIVQELVRETFMEFATIVAEGRALPLETVLELSRHPNILGLKDSERDEQRMIRGIKMFRDNKDFSFFVVCTPEPLLATVSP